jgi:hypothetical protein
MDADYPISPKCHGHNSVPFAWPSPFRRETVDTQTRISHGFGGFAYKWHTIPTYLAIGTPSHLLFSCTRKQPSSWIPFVQISPFPHLSLGVHANGRLFVDGPLQPWFSRVFIIPPVFGADSHLPNGDLSLSCRFSGGRADRFCSTWTTANTTIGCVLSSRDRFSRTQQFFTHWASETLAACAHVIVWRGHDPMIGSVYAASFRRPGARPKLKSVLGDTPSHTALTLTLSRAVPRLGVKRLKTAFGAELQENVPRMGIGVNVHWENGVAFYLGSINSKRTWSLQLPLGQWTLKIVAEKRQKGTDVGVAFTHESGESREKSDCRTGERRA